MTTATEADWKLLSDLLAERFGLSFSGARQEILETRLRSRLEALHLEDARAYYHYLRFHPGRDGEFEELTRRLTNNETYFFRETAQLDAIVNKVVPELAPERRGTPIRVLSAGCSSGEEPYSLAVRMADTGFELSGIRWEIDACDLHPGRLAQAARGIYEGLSLRACDDAVKQHCFMMNDGKHQLKERYRKNVRFFQANLAAPCATAGWARYDIVLCRNVLIYFAPDAFARAIARFEELLNPGGYLFLGHSESLFDRGGGFLTVHFPNTVGYRRVREP